MTAHPGHYRLYRTLHFLSAFFAAVFIVETCRAASPEEALSRARSLFYESVEDRQAVEPAMALFRKIGAQGTQEGLAMTYIGALTALQGKYALFPMTKYRRAKKGIALMNRGVAMDPDQIESRFVRGMTCYYLPFFFHMKETALLDFQVLIRLLETEYGDYDAGIVGHIIDFLLNNVPLSEEEMRIIQYVQDQIGRAG